MREKLAHNTVWNSFLTSMIKFFLNFKVFLNLKSAENPFVLIFVFVNFVECFATSKY